jgi:hypothetical protein
VTIRTSSELGYYVRQRARQLQGQRPMATERARWLVNNLDHLQDESTQTAATACTPNGTSAWTQTATATDTYALFDQMPTIPTMLRCQSDGSSSRIVVTLGGISTSSAGKLVTFAVTLKALRPDSSAPPYTPLTGAITATTTTTSTSDADAILTVYVPRLTDEWLFTSGIGLDSDGTLAAVGMYGAQIEVWGSTSFVGANPRVKAVSIREWVGSS